MICNSSQQSLLGGEGLMKLMAEVSLALVEKTKQVEEYPIKACAIFFQLQ